MKTTETLKDIYVTDIDYEVTEEELRQLFSLCGEVRAVYLQLNANGQFKGAAFIRMANARQTKEAINMLDGTLLRNRCIRVQAARPKSAKQTPVQDDPAPEKRPRRRRTPKGRQKPRSSS